MRRAIALAIGLSLPALTGCNGADRKAEAITAFLAFERACRQGDAQALGALVTEESLPAVAALCAAGTQRVQPFEVTDAFDLGGRWEIVLRAKGPQGTGGSYLVCREHGRFVVDVAATAALHATVNEDPNSALQFEPRELTPAEQDEVRRRELATPPGQPVR